jgi:HEAT repeat protein
MTSPSRASKETREHLVERLKLERDPAVLAAYVRHASWQVRWQAMESLAASHSPDAVAPLLGVLEDPRHRDDLPGANAALGALGSKAAIPALTALIHHPVEDVKTSAIHALKEIGDASLTPVYLDALSDRSWVAKWYAMHALAEHGDDRAIDAVCDRLRASLSRDRKTNIGGMSEVDYALVYLHRWRTSNVRAEDTIRWVRNKAYDRLHPAERTSYAELFGE